MARNPRNSTSGCTKQLSKLCLKGTVCPVRDTRLNQIGAPMGGFFILYVFLRRIAICTIPFLPFLFWPAENGAELHEGFHLLRAHFGFAPRSTAALWRSTCTRARPVSTNTLDRWRAFYQQSRTRVRHDANIPASHPNRSRHKYSARLPNVARLANELLFIQTAEAGIRRV